MSGLPEPVAVAAESDEKDKEAEKKEYKKVVHLDQEQKQRRMRRKTTRPTMIPSRAVRECGLVQVISTYLHIKLNFVF